MKQLLQSPDVVLLGTGNVAQHLGMALHKAGAQIRQVVGRDAGRAAVLAKKLFATPVTAVSAVSPHAQLYVIAVNDDAIAEVAALLPAAKGLVVHTAGSVGLDALRNCAVKKHGVLYPLQTFSKQRRVNFSTVPLCIEASSPAALKQLKLLAAALSDNVSVLDSEQRRAAHLAAVFANNFSNHLFACAAEIAAEHNISFDLLRPLIAETAAKVQLLSPGEAQTGPALRNDKRVLNAHLELLSSHPDLQRIYRQLSQHIRSRS